MSGTILKELCNPLHVNGHRYGKHNTRHFGLFDMLWTVTYTIDNIQL